MLFLLELMSISQWQMHGYRMQYTTFQLAIRDFTFRKEGVCECLKRILVDGEEIKSVSEETGIHRSTINSAKTKLLANLQKQMKIAKVRMIEEVIVDEDHYDIVKQIHSICISPHITKTS